MHISFGFDLTHDSILWICHLYYIIPTMMTMMMMMTVMIRYMLRNNMSRRRATSMGSSECQFLKRANGTEYENRARSWFFPGGEQKKKLEYRTILITILSLFFFMFVSCNRQILWLVKKIQRASLRKWEFRIREKGNWFIGSNSWLPIEIDESWRLKPPN